MSNPFTFTRYLKENARTCEDCGDEFHVYWSKSPFCEECRMRKIRKKMYNKRKKKKI